VAKGNGEIENPSSKLVKYLGVAAAALGIAGAVLEVVTPIAQQMGKNKKAKAGLERAISVSVLFTLVKAGPRLVGQVRKLRAQLEADVAA
jgi:hypothetical protein